MCRRGEAINRSLGALSAGVIIAGVLVVAPARVASASSGDVYAKGTVYCASDHRNHGQYSGFGPPIDLNVGSGSDDHGWPLYAPEDGHVTVLGGSGWGNAVAWSTESDWRNATEALFMAHLSAIVKTGPVDAGDLIARVGNTGHSDGAHLHMGRRSKGVAAELVLSGQRIVPAADPGCNRYTSKGAIQTEAAQPSPPPFTWAAYGSSKLTRNGWTSGDLAIALSCLDESGCGRTEFRIDSAPVRTGRKIRFEREARHAVRYRSIGSGGAAEAWRKIVLGIDKTPPIVTLSLDESGDVLIASASDPKRGSPAGAAGVVRVMFTACPSSGAACHLIEGRRGGGRWTARHSEHLAPQTYDVKATAEDAAGIRSKPSRTVRVTVADQHTYADLVRASRPVGYWRLDEGRSDLEPGWSSRWWRRAPRSAIPRLAHDTMSTAGTPDLGRQPRALDSVDINPLGQADYFNGASEAYVVPRYDEAYRLTVTTDDGVRVKWNGSVVISKWNGQGKRAASWTTPRLVAGRGYWVSVEHHDGAGPEKLLLEWSSASQPKSPVPGYTQRANDDSGSGMHGRYQRVSYGASGVVEKAASFGPGRYINVPESGRTKIDLSRRLSLEAWVRWNGRDAKGSAVQVIAGKTAAFQWGIADHLKGIPPGTLVWALRSGSSGGWRDSGLTVEPRQWTHLALTYDGESVRSYYNGEPVSSKRGPGGDIAINDQDFRIGAGGGDGPPNSFFNGALDEVAVYGAALTPSTIGGHYAAAVGGD